MRASERRGEIVEIARVAPDAVDADDDARVPRIAPFVVHDAVEAVRRQALENGARGVHRA